MKPRPDSYRVYGVFDDDDLIAILPESASARPLGDVFRTRIWNGSHLQSIEQEINPLDFSNNVLSTSPSAYIVGTLNEKHEFDRWLGSFIDFQEASRYYSHCNSALHETCTLRQIEQGRPL